LPYTERPSSRPRRLNPTNSRDALPLCECMYEHERSGVCRNTQAQNVHTTAAPACASRKHPAAPVHSAVAVFPRPTPCRRPPAPSPNAAASVVNRSAKTRRARGKRERLLPCALIALPFVVAVVRTTAKNETKQPLQSTGYRNDEAGIHRERRHARRRTHGHERRR